MIYGKYVSLFTKIEVAYHNEEITIVVFSNNGADIQVVSLSMIA